MLNKEKFEEAYLLLNQEQREAVDQIDGPVMVIAGPGTGKTQILSLRIANILLQTDASPSNILCLTYTEAGVIAMRNRLASFIATEAYQVNIHTYHSFCNSVIQENRSKFGDKLKMENISDIEFIDLCNEIVDEMDNNNPIKSYADDYSSVITRFKPLFADMKKEGWTSEFLKDKVEECLEALRDSPDMYYKKKGPNYKAGDFKQNDFDKHVKSYEKLLAGADAFDQYNAKLRKGGKYDFEDMINFVIQAFETDKDLLADYQEKYMYILVDEFQDSNGTQIQLLNLLLSYWESPNVFVVGDEDQAIYRFQGADISNIQNFIKRYQDEKLKIIPLRINYRSVQPILDASYTLIKDNKERLAHYFKDTIYYDDAYEKLLASFKTYKRQKDQKASEGTEENNAVTFLKYKNTYTQDIGVIEYIEKLVQDTQIPYQDIAILYTKHAEAENLIKMCHERKIPFDIRYGINVLEHKIIQQLIDLLSYIDLENRRVDFAPEILFKILHHDYLAVEMADIANISRHIKDNKDEKWRELISSREKLFKLGLIRSGAISEVAEQLDALFKMSYNLNTEELLEEILLRMGIYSHVFREENALHKLDDLQAIATFFNFVKEETKNTKRHRLKNLLLTIEDMLSYNLRLNCEKIISNDKGIQFRTAHSAKGLEYKYVFILNATEKTWEKKTSNNHGFKYPENIAKGNNLEEDQRRLFYVAMTRAEERLFLCIPIQDIKEKSLNISKFVTAIENEIGNNTKFPLAEIKTDIVETYLSTLIKRPRIVFDKMEEKLVREALKNFTMSASSLNKYLNCKLSFYFEQVLKVPTAKSSALAFGSMIHNVLEETFKYINEHKTIPTFEYVKNEYAKQIERYKYSFNERQFEKRVNQGHKVIEEYYNHYHKTWDPKKLYQIEKSFSAYFEGIPLFGKLDNIEIHQGQALVVDYKTGNPDKSTEKLKRPNEKKPNGGDIWRQVIFYQILLMASKYKYPMSSGIVDFLEKSKTSNSFVREKIVPDLESIEIVKSQIKQAWQGIQDLDFYTGCGDKDCVWCNFVKNNYKNIELVEDQTLETE